MAKLPGFFPVPLGLSACLLSCGSTARAPAPAPAPPVVAVSADVEFDRLARDFLERYLAVLPVVATDLGDHRFDGRWPAIGAEGEDAQRKLIAATRAELGKIDATKLGPEAQVDRAILEDELDGWTFGLDRLHSWTHDPLYYTGLIGDGLDPLVTRDFAPHAERMTSLGERLHGIPAVVAAAKKILAHPSKVATETAITQNQGLIALVDKELPPEFAKEPSQTAALQSAAAEALVALRDFQTFLEKDLLPRSDGDFRIGADTFRAKLRYTLGADTPADELYADATDLLHRTQDEMVETALELWPELFHGGRGGGKARPQPKTRAERLRVVRTVLDRLAEDHPTNATIIDETRKVADAATEFVRSHDLVEVPAEPLRVIVVPEYKRGFAVAYCESSGPLEKKRDTVVAISPTPADWPPARTASFYREYNRAMLAELAIHEAMPGHYLQAAHFSRVTRPIRAVFQSGPFGEGWAVYGEWLMAKYGFGGPRVRLERLKMILRVAANAILDHDLHTGHLTREEALKLMMVEAMQEEGEAAGKWRRAQLSSTQLTTYFYGFHQMMQTRSRAEKEPGFTERSFHDKLLSFGSPPPRLLGALVFGDPLP